MYGSKRSSELGGCVGWTEGKAGLALESRALGQGSVRTQDWERQEPLLEPWVTGAQLTQWQRTVLQGQETTQQQDAALPQCKP